MYGCAFSNTGRFAPCAQCWSGDVSDRPSSRAVVERLGEMIKDAEKGQKEKKGLGGLIDRHSTWF